MSFNPRLYSQSRYLLRGKTDEMTTSARLAQIEPLRGYANDFSIASRLSSDSPYNPLLMNDVDYSAKTKVNVVKHLPLTKYENKYPFSNDIALYDLKINRENSPYFNSILQNQQLAEKAKQTIQMKNSDRLYTNDERYNNAGNGSTYNPYLPESATNMKPKYMKPQQIDDRMLYHTIDKEWNYEADRAKIADDLRHSDHIKERNKLQHEADSALFKWAHVDRNYEPKQEYRNIQPTSKYYLSDDEKIQSSKQNDRNMISDQKIVESFSSSRKLIDTDDVNKRIADIEGAYGGGFDRNISKNFMLENLASRVEQFSNYEANEDKIKNNKTSLLSSMADYITSTIVGAFSWNEHKNREINTSGYYDTNDLRSDNRLKYDEDGSLLPNYDMNKISTNDNIIEKFESDIKRSEYVKSDHMLVVKNGPNLEAYPDEDCDNTAVTFVMNDPTIDMGLCRHMILFDNGKLLLVQKRANEAIFNGDNMPVNGDLLVIELPIEAIDYKVRDHIKRLNLGSKRDKILELTYDEFVMFRDYIVKHQDLQERLNTRWLSDKVRGNKYDEDIVTNFEGKKTFTSDKVWNNLVDNARNPTPVHVRGRVDKGVDDFVVDGNKSPMDEINLKFESKPVNNVMSSRRIGVKRGQFDG